MTHEQLARKNLRLKKDLEKREKVMKQELSAFNSFRRQKETETLQGFQKTQTFELNKMNARVNQDFKQRVEKTRSSIDPAAKGLMRHTEEIKARMQK